MEHRGERLLGERGEDVRIVVRGVALGGGEERGGGGGEIGARQAEKFRPETEKRFAASVALGHQACPGGGPAQHEQAARRIERDEPLDGAMVR